MQSYVPKPMLVGKVPQIEPDYFVADSKKKLNKLMNKAAKNKSKKGYNVLKRIKIDPNGFCPCDSGEKFQLCCMNKAITN